MDRNDDVMIAKFVLKFMIGLFFQFYTNSMSGYVFMGFENLSNLNILDIPRGV